MTVTRDCFESSNKPVPLIPLIDTYSSGGHSTHFYRPQRSCGQGNIFTPVCHSVHGGEWSRGVSGLGGCLVWGWCLVGGCLVWGCVVLGGIWSGGCGPGGCLVQGGVWGCGLGGVVPGGVWSGGVWSGGGGPGGLPPQNFFSFFIHFWGIFFLDLFFWIFLGRIFFFGFFNKFFSWFFFFF